MDRQELPWSFYAILASFAIFFGCLNIYLLTLWLDHPFGSWLWLLGAIIGLILLIVSIYMMRIQQRDMIMRKREKIVTEM